MIRLANKHDIDDIVRLIKDFAIKSDNIVTKDPMKWSETHVRSILAHIFAGKGFCLIDDKKTALLIAVKAPIFWIDNIYQLQEVMLHGYSKITIGRLIKEYCKIARGMIANGEITQATISSYKDDGFERLGMKKIEIHWEVE